MHVGLRRRCQATFGTLLVCFSGFDIRAAEAAASQDKRGREALEFSCANDSNGRISISYSNRADWDHLLIEHQPEICSLVGQLSDRRLGDTSQQVYDAGEQRGGSTGDDFKLQLEWNDGLREADADMWKCNFARRCKSPTVLINLVSSPVEDFQKSRKSLSLCHQKVDLHDNEDKFAENIRTAESNAVQCALEKITKALKKQLSEKQNKEARANDMPQLHFSWAVRPQHFTRPPTPH